MYQFVDVPKDIVEISNESNSCYNKGKTLARDKALVCSSTFITGVTRFLSLSPAELHSLMSTGGNGLVSHHMRTGSPIDDSDLM